MRERLPCDSRSPTSVVCVVGIAGHGLHRDRSSVTPSPSGYNEPDLLGTLANTPVSMTFMGVGNDIWPDWPLQQLASLVPGGGSFRVVADVPHDFCSTHPETWRMVVSQTCRAATPGERSRTVAAADDGRTDRVGR